MTRVDSPARRGRLPAAERARRRAEVLDAALQVITERGYEGTTMNAIAERAGASKETLYAWFGTREGLVSALIERHADASAERVVEALDGTRTDLATVRATLEGYAEALLGLLTGPTSVALNRAAMTAPALAQALLTAGRHRTGPVVEQYLAHLHEAGVIDAPLPAEAFATLYGLVVRDTQIRVLLGEEPPSADAVATRARQAVDHFLTLTSGMPEAGPRQPPTESRSGSSTTPEARRVREALEMYEFGVEMFRQRIRRERPGVDEAEVDALTRAWLLSAPRPERLRAALGDQAW